MTAPSSSSTPLRRTKLARLEPLRRDFRLALRALCRAPGFAFATLLMLSLSIALNATAFRVLDTMLLRGYPLVRDNGRLLYINELSPRAGCCVSYFDFDHWRSESRAFEELAFMAPRSISLAEGDGDARTFRAYSWTPNIFHLLGVEPALGRDFRATDAVPGAAPVVIVSHRYWQTHLAGRPDVVGRSVRIDGVPVTIVGVTPEGFAFQADNDVWLPLVDNAALHDRVLNGGSAYGRLAPGATQAEARAELEAINERLAREYPDSNRDVRPVVNNYRESRGAAATLFYGSLWLGAWLVLLIACTNAANLALARTQERTRELSTRIALGAPRARLGRQLFIEHSALAAVAGLGGWWVSSFATGTWAAATGTLNAAYDYSPSVGTWSYVVSLTLGAAALIAAAPIAHLWRLDVNESLKGAARGATTSLRAKRLARLLVARVPHGDGTARGAEGVHPANRAPTARGRGEGGDSARGGLLAARGHRHRGAGARQAGTALSLREPPGGGRGAARAHRARRRECAAEKRLSRWHHARGARASRFSRAARGTRAAAADAPHALPRRVRPAPCAARGDHAGRPRPWRSAGGDRRAAGIEARGDELGSTAQAGVRDRHRALPALRRKAAGDREHRGPGAHRADSRAPRAIARGRPAVLVVYAPGAAAAVAARPIVPR